MIFYSWFLSWKERKVQKKIDNVQESEQSSQTTEQSTDEEYLTWFNQFRLDHETREWDMKKTPGDNEYRILKGRRVPRHRVME